MKLKCRNKTISNLWLITVIILTAITISMFALLYNSGINNTYEEATIYEVKTTNELETANELITARELVTANELAITNDLVSTNELTHKAISNLSNVTILSNFYLDEFFLVVFIIFCTILFISLPDNLTLLNLKVRLND